MFRRIMQRGLPGLLAGLLGWASLGGAEKGAAERVPQWIQDLGSSQYDRREAATKELDALGPAALDALREAAHSEDLEVGRRAQALVERIERRAQASRLLEPRRVHLVYKATPLSQAVADFAKKTGYPLQLPHRSYLGSNRTVTLDTGEVTFWEALEQFCRHAGLTEQSRLPSARVRPAAADANQLRREQEVRLILREEALLGINNPNFGPSVTNLTLVDGKAPTLPTSYAGAVRVQAVPPELSALPTVKTADQVQVVLEVTPEPKLDWKKVVDLRIEQAIDDQGRLLEPAAQVGKALSEHDLEMRAHAMLSGQNGNTEWFSRSIRQIPVTLKRNQATPKRVKELKGTLSALVVTPPEVLLTVDDLVKAAGKSVPTRDGSDLKLVDVRHDSGGRLFLNVEVPAWFGQLGTDPVINRRQRMGRMVINTGDTIRPLGTMSWAVEDAAGKRLSLTGMQTRFRQKENELVQEHLLTFHVLRGQEGPFRLTLTGHRLVVLDVPFTLRDIPVP